MKRSLLLVALLASIACKPPPSFRLPLAPTYTFRQAENAFVRADYATAADSYRRFVDSAPDPAYLPRAFYQMALAQYYLHQYGATLASLDELDRRLPHRQWVQALALRGDAEFGLGNHANAVQAWEKAWIAATPAEIPRLHERFVSVRSQLTNAEREEVSRTVTASPVRAALGLTEPPAVTVAPKTVATIDTTAATAAPRLPPKEPSVADEVPVLDASEHETMAGREVALEPDAVPESEPATKVACLLPLTGPDYAYGKRALAGLRLAFADAPQQLVVRDTGGQPATGAALLEQLRQDPKVMAVIGPLRSSEAEVAAPLAERDEFPMLLLSQREGLTGRFVLQAAMTRTQQAELLAHYSVDILKLQKFGILYPNDGYGSAFSAAFKGALTDHGASVSGTQFYEPGAPDFATISDAVKRWRQVGVDAVFIPDAAPAATAVAAEVRDALPGIALLGTESWNDTTTLTGAGARINGAIFTDAFFLDSVRPSTRQFVERFEKDAGRPPTVFEAQAFDAGMVMRQILSAGTSSRDQVIGELNALGTFEGAGELHSSPNGFQRALSLLRYRDGHIEEVTPGS